MKLAAAAMAVLLALGLCELTARLFFPAPPEPAREPQLLFEVHPSVGFLHKPDQQGWLDDGLATINALGLRGSMPPTPKPRDEFRIVLVGDSTTFGWGVNDDETYGVHLERLLSRMAQGRQVRVVNAGVAAYDLEHAARLLRHLAPSLEPDLVLVGLFWNDLPYERTSPDGVRQQAPASAAAPGRPNDGRPRRQFRLGNQPSRFNRVLRSSRMMFVIRHAWLAAIAPTQAATNQVRWEMALLDGRRSAPIDDAWAALRETVGGIREQAAGDGFAAGVVVMPIRAQVEREYPAAAYQTRVGAIASELGLFVVDPLPLLRAERNRASLFIPYDRMHFSAAGNALIARAVSESPEVAAALGIGH
jgi:lysophospholipase L1-like esterase